MVNPIGLRFFTNANFNNECKMYTFVKGNEVEYVITVLSQHKYKIYINKAKD